MSLLLMDVDHLKTINDTGGHPGGDAALQQVATALHQAGRPNDVAARFGGDEFALLVPESGIVGALKFAERIHAALRVATDTVHVTVSIGAATINTEITTVDELLHAADTALYTVKRTGRGRTALTISRRRMLSRPPQAWNQSPGLPQQLRRSTST